MNGRRSARFAIVFASAIILGVSRATAQSQPATIPTVVAEAMSLEASMFGRPQFFDGRTPTGWPAALVPPSAKVLGGGTVGDSAMFRMRVAVFELPAQSNPRAAIDDVVTRAGYVNSVPAPRSQTGGFAETPASTVAGRYCKGLTLAAFGPVDSANAPRVFALTLIDGEAGRLNCTARRDEPMGRRFPAAVPALLAPAGVMSVGGGSSSSGSSGEMRSTLRTTMPTDSLLAHYSAQLVAGGWKAEARPANASGVGIQRFSFRDGQDAWTGVLVIMAIGDRRQVLLQVDRSE